MNRAIPPLLAVLLGLSLTVVPIVAASGTGSSASATPSMQRLTAVDQSETDLRVLENTTNRLSLENASRREYAEPAPGLGSMLASTDDELRTDHVQYAIIDRGYADATDEEQQRRLRDAYEQLRERSDAIESRERRAVRAHARGELSSAQLLQTLLRNSRDAATLSEAFDDLIDRASNGSNLSRSMKDERGKLEMYQTEFRSRLASSTSEQPTADGDLVSVETSVNGYVVSMVDENYVREAARFDNRDTSRPTQFSDLTDAYEYSLTRYPWANETRRSPSFNEYTAAQLYLLNIGHDHGSLRAYLDGGTGAIHRESQVLSQRSLPTAPQHTVNKGNLTLSVNETAGNGPSELTVTDSETGEPKSATVTINGTEIGETAGDGTLWYIPPGERYDLTVETAAGDATVNASIGIE